MCGESYYVYTPIPSPFPVSLPQEYIRETKLFISSCGTYANLVRQAKSRQKILDKMEEAGLVQEPFSDPRFQFSFPEVSCGPLSLSGVMDVVACAACCRCSAAPGCPP